MNEQLLSVLREQDTFAAVELAAQSGDQVQAAKSLHELGKHLYWKEKDLGASVTALRAGAQIGMTSAETEPSRRIELRSAAKGMCYDLASFTWPGWDEPGIKVTACDMWAGLDAAKANLRLGEELNKGDLPLSRAYWMLAAHLMAARRWTEAIAHFERAAKYAESAASRSDALLSAGFATLTALLERPEDMAAAARLEEIKAALAPLEHGADFVSQIETAAAVLAPFGR